MVTLTLRHSRADTLRELVDLLLRAWRWVRSRRPMRDIFDRRVTATVRALEVTGGWGVDARGKKQGGWHPHVHLLMKTSEWTEGEQRILLWLWNQALGEHAGTVTDSVWWSTPIDDWQKERARYAFKLGCEIAGVGKTGTGGSLNQWGIAEAALTDDAMARRWTEFQNVMRGRRILELDERAAALVEAAAVAEPEVKQEWTFMLSREEYSALAKFEQREPMVLWMMVESALRAGPDPPRILADALHDFLTWQKPLAA